MEKGFPFHSQVQVVQNPMLKGNRDHQRKQVLKTKRVKLVTKSITKKIKMESLSISAMIFPNWKLKIINQKP